MKLKVTYLDASEPDCRRVDYVVYVDGKQHLLTGCALGNEHNDREALKRARELFGPDVELEF